MKGGRGPFSEIGVETAEDEADGVTGVLPLPARLADLAMLSSVRSFLTRLFLESRVLYFLRWMLPSPIAASTQAAGVVYVSPMLYVSRWVFIAQIKVLWMAMTTIDSGDLVVSKSVDQNCAPATKIEVVDVREGLNVILA